MEPTSEPTDSQLIASEEPTSQDRTPQEQTPSEVTPQENRSEYEHFAQLTGYQPPTGTKPGTTTDSKETVPLLDKEDLQTTPQEQKTQQQSWNNPYVKAVVVALLFAIPAYGISLFVHSANGIQAKSTPETPTKTVAVAPSPTPQDEVGDLKTQTALETQADAIKAANAPKPPTPSVPLPTPISHPVVSAIPRSFSPSYSAPFTQAISHSSDSSSASSAQPVDPDQAWQKAQQIGSYGQVAYTAPAAATPVSADGTTSGSTSGDDANYQQQSYQADEDAIMNGTVRQFSRVTAGSFTSGNLETPIVWAQDLDSSQQPQRFAMTLSQPLTGGDGSVALPAGSVLVLSVNGVDQSGLVTLNVDGAIVQKNNTQETISIPPGALTVESSGNKPLIARQYNGVGHQIANMDRSLAIMGGLSGLGQFVTSPRSSTVSQSLTSTISSSTNRKVNAGTIIGSVLNGAFSSLDSQVSQHDTQEIRDLMNRPNVWYIPDGQTLQVFANSSFEVGL